MLKAVSGDILFLGLEAGNLEKLMDDQPIDIHMSDVGNVNPSRIVIFYGRGHDELCDALEKMTGTPMPQRARDLVKR